MQPYGMFQIGWEDAWWFTVAFGLVNAVFLLRGGRKFRGRVIQFPLFSSRVEKIVSYLSVVVFMRGLMVLTVFVPLRLDSLWFCPGLAVYAAGLVLYTGALHQFSRADRDRPVTAGVYRISRHPMQVFSLVMWLGVGMATASPVILAVCCVQPFLARVFMISQERYCLQRYGDPYREYLERTPRFLGIRRYRWSCNS